MTFLLYHSLICSQSVDRLICSYQYLVEMKSSFFEGKIFFLEENFFFLEGNFFFFEGKSDAHYRLSSQVRDLVHLDPKRQSRTGCH
jgi:hypothetical protein